MQGLSKTTIFKANSKNFVIQGGSAPPIPNSFRPPPPQKCPYCAPDNSVKINSKKITVPACNISYSKEVYFFSSQLSQSYLFETITPKRKYTSEVLHFFCPILHLSYISFVLHLIYPTEIGKTSFVLHFICPAERGKHHLVLHLILSRNRGVGKV